MVEGFSSASGLPEDIADVFRLDGRCAVVTGAASGLGRAIALGFARFEAEWSVEL
jgi:NADP-dependent 3-hydroxy acid dehydrogenase YdfG